MRVRTAFPGFCANWQLGIQEIGLGSANKLVVFLGTGVHSGSSGLRIGVLLVCNIGSIYAILLAWTLFAL